MTLTKTLASATVAVTLAAGAASAQETWQMTTTWPSSLDLIQFDKHFVDLANKLAGDEVTIEFFEGGSLVPSGEVFGAVESGIVQAGADWPGYWAGRDPAFSPLATTSSLFNAVDYVNWIQQWGGQELYNETYGKFGMVYLPYAVTNNESGFHTKEAIRTIDDLQGKRLRVSGLEQGRLLNNLGGSQVSMAGGEIYQSLEAGVIDGAEFSTPNVDWSGGFQQVTGYWATPGWHQSASVFG
ncbi:MAG: ABC transporter substrate-binding protein, partial [Tritonibacter mobilis]|nr:ABC transporter substrate-binding protein [Tritonibacter mobilis]